MVGLDEFLWSLGERLGRQLEMAQDAEAKQKWAAELCRHFEAVHKLQNFGQTTFQDKAEAEDDEWLRAIGYEDRLAVDGNMKRFYRCLGCGTYFSSKVRVYNRVARKWYCRLDWMALLQVASPDLREELEEAFGEDSGNYPQVGRGMFCKSWARDKGTLVEFKLLGEEWQCFISDMLPECLEREIERCEVKFRETTSAWRWDSEDL